MNETALVILIVIITIICIILLIMVLNKDAENKVIKGEYLEQKEIFLKTRQEKSELNNKLAEFYRKEQIFAQSTSDVSVSNLRFKNKEGKLVKGVTKIKPIIKKGKIVGNTYKIRAKNSSGKYEDMEVSPYFED